VKRPADCADPVPDAHQTVTAGLTRRIHADSVIRDGEMHSSGVTAQGHDDASLAARGLGRVWMASRTQK